MIDMTHSTFDARALKHRVTTMTDACNQLRALFKQQGYLPALNTHCVSLQKELHRSHDQLTRWLPILKEKITRELDTFHSTLALLTPQTETDINAFLLSELDELHTQIGAPLGEKTRSLESLSTLLGDVATEPLLETLALELKSICADTAALSLTIAQTIEEAAKRDDAPAGFAPQQAAEATGNARAAAGRLGQLGGPATQNFMEAAGAIIDEVMQAVGKGLALLENFKGQREMVLQLAKLTDRRATLARAAETNAQRTRYVNLYAAINNQLADYRGACTALLACIDSLASQIAPSPASSNNRIAAFQTQAPLVLSYLG